MPCCGVSIHLMLLFIVFERKFQSCRISFNTSHVTLYHHRYVCIQKNSRRFNTSHVTLYHILPRNHLRMSVFQYISCYSLSAIEKVILIAKKFQYISCYSLSEICISKKLFFLSFNTSHVTLYLMFPFYDKREPRCFNTSHVTLYRQKKKLLLLRLIGFNTSHVTLYPCPDCCNRKSDQCFNTSHVTLYQEEREIREDKEEVSIHLMLLFIAVPAHVRTDQLEVSIHLMLLFIKRVRIHIHALD